jgi:hypothetical protein
LGDPVPCEQELYNDVPDDANGQATDFGPVSNLLQVAMSNSCSDLINSDGSLTDLGKDTVGCILGGVI